MKKIIKSFSAVALSLCILVSSVCTAFAAKSKYPVIIIPGIQNAEVYQDLGTSKEKQVFAPAIATEELIQMVKGLSKIQDYRNHFDYLQSFFVPTLQKWCNPIKCDGNGEDIYNNSVYCSTASYAEDPEYVGSTGGTGVNYAENFSKFVSPNLIFRFQYDWRKDCVDMVHNQLRPFIETIKAKTGAEKVKLVCFSMGGVPTSIYLSDYGHLGDIQSVTFVNSAIQGTTFPGEIFTGKLQINKDTVATSMHNVIGEPIAELLAAIGIYFDDINKMWSGKGHDYFYENFVIPYVAHWPGLMELMPNEYVEKAISYCFNSQADAGIIAKIRRYAVYQKNAAKTLQEAQKNGIAITNVVSYNIDEIPLEAVGNTSDILIDTKYESVGAVCAKSGETLGDNYKQEVADDHEHVSADKIIDASTCALPENTWFIKDIVHCLYYNDKEGSNFIRWIVSQDEQVTVHDNADYPQFLKYYPSTGKLTPLVLPSAEVPGTTGMCTNSKPTVYTYTELTLLGWICYVALPIAIIIALIVLASRKGKKKDILAGCEIEGLQEITDDMPKKEKKAAQKANKKVLNKYWKANKTHLIAQYKFCNDKLAPYAVPGIVEIKDDMSKKEIKQAEKTNKKARKAYYKENKKDLKKDFKANKKQKKIDKKEAKKQAKADKKAAKASKK